MPFWYAEFLTRFDQQLTRSANLRKTLIVVLCRIRSISGRANSAQFEATSAARFSETPAGSGNLAGHFLCLHVSSVLVENESRDFTRIVASEANLGTDDLVEKLIFG
jgi:hypothetical protein